MIRRVESGNECSGMVRKVVSVESVTWADDLSEIKISNRAEIILIMFNPFETFVAKRGQK